MPREWKGPYSRRLRVLASERGKRMAAARWKLDRERRNKLAALTAEQFPSRIVRRIIVIDNELKAREAVFWNWESGRDWKRKERAILRK